MLRWARAYSRNKTKKDHMKNEDIWREANIEPTTPFLRKKLLRWYGRVLRKEVEDTTRKMLNILYANAGKQKKDEAEEKMAGQHPGGHERIQHDRGHGIQLKYTISMMHIKTTAGPLLHGGGM